MKTKTPVRPSAAEARQMADHAEIEFRILLGIEQSLRIALQWKTLERGNSHKLSTLRFAASSFERHLTRSRLLADQGGYLRSITEAKPHLASEARAVSDARAVLQANFERIIMRLEYISTDDAAALSTVCSELEDYLDQLKSHGEKEMELLQRSVAQVEGGEG